MDNKNFDLLRSYDDVELCDSVGRIAYSTINPTNFELNDELVRLKEEIDSRLSESDFSVPWGNYVGLSEIPYAKLLYNLSLPITDFKYLYKDFLDEDMYNEFRESVYEYSDYYSHESDDNLHDKYFCEEAHHVDSINILLSKEYPGYSSELYEIDECPISVYFIRLVKD